MRYRVLRSQPEPGGTGTCRAPGQYCTPAGCKNANVTCTTDANCLGGVYGAGAVCAGLEYTFNPETEPAPVPNSGTCCPSGAVVSRRTW